MANGVVTVTIGLKFQSIGDNYRPPNHDAVISAANLKDLRITGLLSGTATANDTTNINLFTMASGVYGAFIRCLSQTTSRVTSGATSAAVKHSGLYVSLSGQGWLSSLKVPDGEGIYVRLADPSRRLVLAAGSGVKIQYQCVAYGR